MEKAKGNRGNISSVTGGNTARPPEETKTLSEMGVTKDQSSKWQKLALKLKEVVAKQAKENQGKRTDICLKSDKSNTPIDTKKVIAKQANLGHTQQAIADELGVSQQTVSEYIKKPLPEKNVITQKTGKPRQFIQVTIRKETDPKMAALRVVDKLSCQNSDKIKKYDTKKPS